MTQNEITSIDMTCGCEIYLADGTFKHRCKHHAESRDTDSTVDVLLQELGAANDVNDRLTLELKKAREVLRNNHRRVCTRENCVLDGGLEHDEAFTPVAAQAKEEE